MARATYAKWHRRVLATLAEESPLTPGQVVIRCGAMTKSHYSMVSYAMRQLLRQGKIRQLPNRSYTDAKIE